MRALRCSERRIQVEAGKQARSLCAGEPRRRGAGLSPEYAGFHVLLMERDRAEIPCGKGTARSGKPGGNESLGEHGAGRDVGGAGRAGGGCRAAEPARAVRRRRAGGSAGADSRCGRAGRPLRGGGGRLGHRQGELGHPLPEDIRRYAERAGMARPRQFPVGGVQEERRGGAAHHERLHRHRRTPHRSGIPLHGGTVGAKDMVDQGQGRRGRAIYPKSHHQQPRKNAAVHHRRGRGKGPAVSTTAA